MRGDMRRVDSGRCGGGLGGHRTLTRVTATGTWGGHGHGDVAMGSTRPGTPTLPGDRDTPKRHEDPDKYPPPPTPPTLHWVIVHACAWPCMCVHRHVHVAGHACLCCRCHACAHTCLRTSMGCVCERQHVCTYMRVQACRGAPIPVCAHACARGGRWNHPPGCSWGPGPGSLSRWRRERPAGCPETSPGSPHAPRAGGSTGARSPGKGRRLQGWPEGAEAGGGAGPPPAPPAPATPRLGDTGQRDPPVPLPLPEPGSAAAAAQASRGTGAGWGQIETHPLGAPQSCPARAERERGGRPTGLHWFALGGGNWAAEREWGVRSGGSR